MTWRFDRLRHPIWLLTDGNYALQLVAEDVLAAVRTPSTAKLERLLLEVAGRQMRPEEGRRALLEKFAADGRPRGAQLAEIREALPKLGGGLLSVELLSDGAVRKLHDAVREAFDADERDPTNAVHGVRQLGDWRAVADLLERELTTRGMVFVPVPW